MVRFNLLILLFPALIFSQQGNPNLEYLYKSAVWNIFTNNNIQAKHYIENASYHFPDDPRSKIFNVMNRIAEDSDRGEGFIDNSLEVEIENAINLSERQLEVENNSSNYFSVGISNGLKAYFELLRKDYIAGFFQSLTAINAINKSIELNPQNNDALILIGTYKYWRSEKTKSIDWLPFIDDERDEGIEILKHAIEKNSMYQPIGLLSYIWILIHQKKYEEAAELAEKGSNQFPESRSFIYALAHTHTMHEPKLSVELFKKILSINKYDGIESKYHEITLKHKIAQNYFRLKNYSQALNYCNEILNINDISPAEYDLLGSRLENVKKLKSEILSKIN